MSKYYVIKNIKCKINNLKTMKFNRENFMKNVGMGIYLIGFVALFITSFIVVRG